MATENTPVMEEQDQDNVIYLETEEGKSFAFEFLDEVEYLGENYAVLIPQDDEEVGVLILRIEECNDEFDNYVPVEDTDVLDAVFDIFKEKNKDNFNFV